jgi:hypothetical protein
MRIGPVSAEFFHADRQKADIAKQIVAFRNFAKALKNPNNTFVSHMRNLSVGRKTLEFILNKCIP